MKLFAVGLAALLLLAGCGGGGGASGGSLPPGGSTTIVPGVTAAHAIKHVVIIFQENRSVDNLFNGFPGADTAQIGLNSKGQRIQLRPTTLSESFSMQHNHHAFVVEYAGGAMNGFDQAASTACSTCEAPPEMRAYSYVPQDQTQAYWDMARRYTFADRMFQSNSGASASAHQYITSATSLVSTSSPLLSIDNAIAPSGAATADCDAPPGTITSLIDPGTGALSQIANTCFEHPTLFDLLDTRGISWRYYVAHLGPGLWNGPAAIRHIRYGADYNNVSTPSANVLSDIQSGKLAQVSWVTPTAAASDHSLVTDGSGPAWVASIVNAIGTSQYWSDTAIFITWDDWGGWYDHVKPPQYNAYELGFRVPLIVVSPYARAGYVSHVQHEFGSILKFTEGTFALGSLGYTDARADDLSDCFDFTQTPLTFRTISSKRSASYFEQLTSDARPIDDD